MQVTKNKVVAIDYTLKGADGQVLDSSDGREPLHYLHGADNIIAGLETALEGASPGEALQVEVPPGEGYGERNDDLQQVVARSEFQDVDDLQAGMRFRVRGDTGETVVTVVDVADDTVTLDGNHPLAGATLHFDVTVRDVREATAEEIDHGHAHAPGGHAH